MQPNDFPERIQVLLYRELQILLLIATPSEPIWVYRSLPTYVLSILFLRENGNVCLL